MKKLFILLLALVPVCIYAQDNVAKEATKYEEFTSKAGKIYKFVDVKLDDIPLMYMGGDLETSVRTFMGDSENTYFYRLEKAETQSSLGRIAMIEYNDLVEVNKALSRLSSEVESDIANKPDYLENKFVSEDGLEIGYYVKFNKAMNKYQAFWFIKMERYSKSTVFVKNAEKLIQYFASAQSKIEELKQKNGK